MFRVKVALFLIVSSAVSAYSPANRPAQQQKTTNGFRETLATATATASLAALLLSSEPAMAMSSTAAQIHLNSLPPSTISVQIGDLPVVGSLLSGTYTRVDTPLDGGKPAVIIRSPSDKLAAVKDVATGGHLEFDVDGLLNTHLDVDVAASKAGVATVRVASPLIPQLPFKNSASASAAAGQIAVAKGVGSSKTAAKISLESLPPSAISVEIGDLPVVGKALSGVYTKVDSSTNTDGAAIVIQSPKDRLSAVKNIATGGHLEFDVDGLLTTHLDVDIAADKAGIATVKVASPVIPQLPFKNSASVI